MWSNKSGGGPEIATNSPTEIVPHLFKHDTDARGFYDTPEKDLREMVYHHYENNKKGLSPFSSWSSSLHLVLCYAKFTDFKYNVNPHVAVMDTQNLDRDVLVWHCPELDLRYGVHEYLAYGPIRGERGYRAVSLECLETCGILQLFSELQKSDNLDGQFGIRLRSKMFEENAKSLTSGEFLIAEHLAKNFGPLFLPVYIALLCLQPRPWYTSSTVRDVCEDQEVINEITGVLDRNDVEPKLTELAGQEWLKVDVVETTGFPDVSQWIGLLSAIVKAKNP